jgi:hypothetical protein
MVAVGIEPANDLALSESCEVAGGAGGVLRVRTDLRPAANMNARGTRSSPTWPEHEESTIWSLAGRAAEADLVPLGITVDGLAYSVGVGLALGGADATGGDLRHERIEVVHEDRMESMSGALSVFQDEDRATLGQIPNGLSLVREEGRLGAEQALVPWSRRRVVTDADPGVEVECHGPIVALLPASGAPQPPTTGPTVHVSIARRQTLNSGGILPLALGIPMFLGALSLGLRLRRRAS